MNTIIEITNAILELLIVLIFFKKTLQLRSIDKKIHYTTILSVLAIHIIRSFIPFQTYTNMAITFILWSILLIILFKDSIFKKFIIILTYFVVVIICDIISRFIISAMLQVSYNTIQPSGIQRYIIMILNLFLYFTILTSISMFIKRKNSIITTQYWIMMLLFPIFSLFIVISMDIFMILANVQNTLCVFALITIIVGLLYFNIMVFDFIDSYSAKIQLDAAEQLIEKQAENYHMLEINEKNMRQLQHDLNKHVDIIQHMIDKHEVKDPQQILGSVKTLTKLPISIIYTNDSALDSILNVKCKRAIELGIKYLVKTHNVSVPLNIDPIDKSTILCNALDNALEACEKVKEKFIVIDIESDANKIKICIENSSLPINLYNNSILTTKSDGVNHGFGISNIKRTLKKYNGILNFSHSDGITKCIILLDNPAF